MKTGNCCIVCKLATLLAGLGALNWGLVAFMNMDLVTKVFGLMTTGSKIVYGLIALAGLMKLASLVVTCPCSKADSAECKK